MDSNKETFETWNNIAQLYEQKFMDMDIYNHSYDSFIDLLEIKNPKILELGCGPGNISKYLLNKRPDIQLHGIDIAPKMIELAQKNISQAFFEVADCRDLSHLNQKFHALIAGFCLPYFNRDETLKLFADCKRLLNSNAIIYFSFVEGDPQNSTFKTGGGGRVYFNYHSMDFIKNILNENEISIIREFEVNYKTSDNDFDIHNIIIGKMNN